MDVIITGKATMRFGSCRILADVVPGDCSLQEGTRQSGFSMNVETAALNHDTSGTRKNGIATSIIMTFFAASTSLFFF